MARFAPRLNKSSQGKGGEYRPVSKEFDEKMDKLFGARCPKCKQKEDADGNCRCTKTLNSGWRKRGTD